MSANEKATNQLRYTFDEVKIYADKTTKCRGCGKRLKRSKKFSQTLNPFNKRTDGTVKTPEDIYAELRIEAKQWQTEAETCQACSG